MGKMNPEVKAKWLAALRSGEYEQGQHYLKCEDTFCCLGVATDLYIKDTGNGQWTVNEDGETVFKSFSEEEGGVLPTEVMEWAGLTSDVPDLYIEDASGRRTRSVVELNDGGKPFSEIADMIEAQL